MLSEAKHPGQEREVGTAAEGTYPGQILRVRASSVAGGIGADKNAGAVGTRR